MEQRRKEQDYKDKKEKRRLVRVLRKKFKIKKGSPTIEFAEKIVDEFYGKVNFGWVYLEMIEWCEEKKKPVSLRRYKNFLIKRIEWNKLKETNNNNEDGEDPYRKQTRELRERYG